MLKRSFNGPDREVGGRAIVVRLLPTAAMIGLLAYFIALILDVHHLILKGDTGRYPAIYAASAALQSGRDPYLPHRGTDDYIYPPLYAFLCEPLTHFSLARASSYLLVINAAFIFVSLLLMARIVVLRLASEGSNTSILIVAFGSALMAMVPIQKELRALEANAFMLLCFVLALYWLDSHPIGAALPLALAINLKYLPLVAIPYLLLRRRWMTAAATVVLAGLVALIPALLTGWSSNLSYLREATGGLLHLTGAAAAAGASRVPDVAHGNSVSLTSALARWAVALGWPKRAGIAMAAAVAAIWIVLVLDQYRRNGVPVFRWPTCKNQRNRPFAALVAMEWGAMLAGTLAFSPNTQETHFLLGIVPATVATALVLSGLPEMGIARFAGAGMMFLGLFLPVSSLGPDPTHFWRWAGLSGWCLLAGYTVVLCAALRRKTSSPRHRQVKRQLNSTARHSEVCAAEIA